MKNVFLSGSQRLKTFFASRPVRSTRTAFALLPLWLMPLHQYAQVTLAFQGGETGDTWGYVSTGADAVAQAQAFMSPNIVTGSASIVVGGNTPGGNCFDVGTGNGPNTARTFTFDAVNISSSTNYTRTLVFNWGNRFPVCVGTGWDSGENLVFTAFHDGVPQPSVTLATGVNNATFSINANQHTWSIPPCVTSFYFEVTVTTNRRDELLFLDDVKLSSPFLNSPLSAPSPVTGDLTVCAGATGTYNVIQEPGLVYTWSGLPAGATFVSPNGTAGAYTIDIDWGSVAPGTYTISVTPSDACGGIGTPQTATVTVTAPSPVSITASGPTTFCAGGSVTLTSSAGSGNTWTPGGSTAASITVTTGGTYTVMVTGSCGAGSASQTVTVNPLPVVSVNNPVTCPGVPVALTASGAVGYTWSPAAGLSATTGASVNATAAASTSWTVSGTDINGCTGTAISNVTVNPAANATISPQPALCANDAPVSLAAADPGGTWSASCGACLDASGQFDPSVAGAGTHTVTYTIAGSCGDTSTVSIVVNPVPDVTASPQNICSGQSTSVSLSSSVGGTGFSWTASPANVTGASAASGAVITQTLSVTTPPTGTVVYTITPVAAGCTGPTLDVTVTVEDAAIDNVVMTPVSCNGANDGSLVINATGASAYSIDGGTNFQPSGSFTGLAPATYTVVVQNVLGCNESTTVTVTEPAVLSVSLSGTDETCAGSCNGTATSAVTGGTMPYTYAWSNGAGNVPATGSLCTGNYLVTVTDSSGCTTSDSVSIGSLSGVSIDSIAVTDVTCFGTATGSISIYTTPAAAQFSIDGGITFQPSFSFGSLPQGTYNIVAQHASGCQATAVVSITQPAALALTVGPATVVCPGQSVTISASVTGGTAPYTYNWDNGLPDAPAHTLSPAVTTTYTVSVTDSLGCTSSTGSVMLTVPAPFAVTASPDQTICPGGHALITAVTTGGLAPYSITWTNDFNAVVLTGADQDVVPPVPAVYTVTAQDNCGTLVTDSLLVQFYQLPQLVFTTDSSRGCAPLVVTFTNTTAANPGDVFTWDFGNGNTGSGMVVSEMYATAGCYDVSLAVTTANGCTADTTVLNAVCVYPVPLADFTFTPSPADVFEPEVQFVNLSAGVDSWSWDFSGMGTSLQHDPAFVFPTDSARQYNVCLYVVSSAGCRDTVCRLVEVQGFVTMYVPNAFTPDGDGLNDSFFPVFTDITTHEFRILVYNRWGQVVFETNDTRERWDGTFNGVKCKPDTYVWKVRYQEGTTNVVKEVTGHVNLLR